MWADLLWNFSWWGENGFKPCLLTSDINAAPFEAGSAVPVGHFAVWGCEDDTIKHTGTGFRIAVVCSWP